MASFPVKWISSTMRGAPIISGTPGTLIAALDAFLLHGWGQVSASQIVVAGGVATATVNAGDTFTEHAVIEVAGATPTAVNGQARVTGGATTTVTWAADAPDGTYTGVITIKYAPVGGWEKAFSKTNVAVYRSTDPESPKFCYRIDDAGTTAARVRGYESMSDVDTGTGPFPTDVQINGGGYLPKSINANATAVSYQMMADSRAVLVAVAAGSSTSATNRSAPVRGFGSMIPIALEGDAWAEVVSCATVAIPATSFGAFDAAVSTGNLSIFAARPAGGLGSSVAADARSYAASSSSTSNSGADGVMGSIASAPNGRLMYSRRYITQGSDIAPRAEIPGVLYIPQSGALSYISPGDVITGSGAMQGRLLLAVGNRATNSSPSAAATGVALLDISGPWR